MRSMLAMVMMVQLLLHCLLMLGSSMHASSECTAVYKKKLTRGCVASRNKQFCNNKPEHSMAYKTGYFVADVVMDALRLHRYLFSVTSAQIITGFTPFYLIARSIDEDIQSRFYDASCHKNINQLPSSCHNIARHGVGVPMVLLSSLALFAHDQDLRTTARIFAIGLPFVHSGKDIIKSIDTKACLRPWHEDFSCTQRSTGGFPSGHMANITYAATLFGMRHGLKFAVPLGLFSAFVFADFINCNRHYFSQIIAGAGLGILYAFAANKVVEYRLAEYFSCSLHTDCYGRNGIKIAYRF